jgi:hypothetical protein
MSTELEDLARQIRHMRHPIKDGLLTLAGDEDCDIPTLTAEFCFGAAQIEHSEVSDSN